MYHTPIWRPHLVSFETAINKSIKSKVWKRNWNHLIQKLSAENWQIKKDSVQSYWNEFESKLVEIVDTISPFNY